MNRFIPTLAAMRALQAAIRHENFSAAAIELGVTQGAISHKIKDLEVRLGVLLFRREARGTVPTQAARRLGRAIGIGMSVIHEALEEIMDSRAGKTVSISALPGFAVLWLFPRLIDFDERFPGISVSLETSDRLTDIAAGDAHLAIRYGRGNYSGVNVEKLLDDHMFPVCSTAFLEANGPFESPQDLLGHTLLIDDTQSIEGIRPSWQRWFELAGEEFRPNVIFKKFGQSNMVVQAALAGRGIALGRSALVVDELRKGKLVIPVRRVFPSGFCHYLVSARNRSQSSHVIEFRRWIKQQAETSRLEIRHLLDGSVVDVESEAQ